VSPAFAGFTLISEPNIAQLDADGKQSLGNDFLDGSAE